MLVITALALCVLCESPQTTGTSSSETDQNIFEDINECLIEYPCEFHKAYWTLQ